MSGLPPAGVSLVAENFNPFMAAISSATAAVDKFSAASGKAASTTGSQFSGAMKESSNAIEGLSMKGLVVANVLGNVITGALGKAWEGIVQFKDKAIESVSTMQDMQIALESLAAREILYSKQTDSMTEALAMGKPVAEAMMESIKELSIASPFPYQQVLSVFQMNMAFGMASDTALKLTKSITDLGALSQNIPGILQRLSYNFSQMSMTGQITQRDVRDLAMAGLDLAKVFDLTLGKSVQEVNDDLKAGKMTFEEVSLALVNYTDKYIGPAAQRASRTLKGLASTMGDIGTFTWGNLFMGAAQEVTNALGDILDKVIAFTNSEAMKATGVVLEVLTGKFINMARGVFDAAGEYGQAIGLFARESDSQLKEIDAINIEAGKITDKTQEMFYDRMANIADNAFSWGAGIVTSLADGMISAAVAALTAAIDFISSILTFWMSPGSPPKMAPDLTKWGFGAVTSWLEGFTEADFSILNSLEGPLKSALGYLTQVGTLSNDKSNKLLADLSKGITAALAGEGNLGDLLSQIENVLGPFGTEMAQLVEQNFALATATEAATKAQEDLVAAQKKEFETGQKVSAQVKEYNDMLRQGASKEALKAKLAQINASRKEQKSAAEQRSEAEKGVIAAEDGLKAIEKQIKLQQELVNQLIELARLQAGDAEKKAGGGGGGGGAKAGGGGGGKAPELPTMDDILNNFKDKLAAGWDAAWQPFKDKWNNSWGPLFAGLQAKWDGFWPLLVASWQKFSAMMVSIWTPVLADLAAKFTLTWDTIKMVWASVVETLQPVFEAFFAAIGRSGISFADVMQAVANTVSFVLTAILAGVQGFVIIVGALFSGIVGAILGYMTTWQSGMNGAWTNLQNAWNNFVTAFTGTGLSWFDRVKALALGLAQLFAALVGWITTPLASVLSFFGGFVLAIVDYFATLIAKSQGVGNDMIAGIVDGIRGGASSVLNAIVDAIENAINAAKAKLGIQSPSKVFMEVGEQTTAGMTKGVQNTAAQPTQAVESMVNQTIKASVSPPRPQAQIIRGGPQVNVQIGDVSISNQAEGDMFQRRVELAVLSALGAA